MSVQDEVSECWKNELALTSGTCGTDDFFLNPWTPLAFGLIYFAVTKTLSHYQDGKNRMQGKRWKAFIVAHNMFLAVYSGWT